MEKIYAGKYEYKGFVIFKPIDYKYWCVFIKKDVNYYDCMPQYIANTLKNCKEWIDNEVNA